MTTELPNVYQLTDAGTAPKFNEAFIQGVNAVEGRSPLLVKDGILRPGAVALWGEHKWWRTLHKAIEEGRTWYYGDHAYFGRGVFFRVTKDALQCNGSFFTDGDRARAALSRLENVSTILKQHKLHDEIKIYDEPKSKKDGFVMICPPSEPLSERSGFTQAAWIDQAVANVKAVTDRRIVLRMKPKVNTTPAPLLKAMEGAYCAVTYTSNIATEVMLGGWPVIVGGPHPADALGVAKGFDHFEDLPLPDPVTLRYWAAALCMNQWTLDEIRRGHAWKAIR